MVKEIEIRTDQAFLTPGETVSVPIIVNLETRTKVRRITAMFHAAERTEADYTTSTTDAKGKTKSETKTAVQYHDIVKNEFLLLGEPPAGCLAGIGDFFASLVGGGKGVYLDAGQYEYTVEFTIPLHAPPSMKGKKCRIFYDLTARVDLPLKFDYKQEHKFQLAHDLEPVQGNPVIAYYPDEKGRSFWQKTFGKDAKLTLALQNDAYLGGDTIVAMFQAETASPIKVKSITVQLICVESTRADGHTDRYVHKSEPVTIADAQEIHGGFSTEFSLTADLVGPDSVHATNFEVDWYMEVNMDVPWAANPSIRTPIHMSQRD